MRELDISPTEWDGIIRELQTVAEVKVEPDLVTVMSRRIVREESCREYERNRKRDQRSPDSVPAVSRKVPAEKLEVRSQKSYLKTPNPASGEACFYCKATPATAGGLRPDETPPEEVPAPVWTCLICAVIKRGRYFVRVEDCRAYIHRTLWTANRARWIQHRKYAFGGKSPFERAKQARQPDPKPEDLPTPEEVRAIIAASKIGQKMAIQAHTEIADRNEIETKEAP